LIDITTSQSLPGVMTYGPNIDLDPDALPPWSATDTSPDRPDTFEVEPGPFKSCVVVSDFDLFSFSISPRVSKLGVVASRSDSFCFLLQNVLKTDDVLGRSTVGPTKRSPRSRRRRRRRRSIKGTVHKSCDRSDDPSSTAAYSQPIDKPGSLLLLLLLLLPLLSSSSTLDRRRGERPRRLILTTGSLDPGRSWHDESIDFEARRLSNVSDAIDEHSILMIRRRSLI
jgi:hypothetical protein